MRITDEMTEHVPLLSGGGGALRRCSTIAFHSHVAAAWPDLDGVRLLKPDTVAQMTRNQLAAPLIPLEIGGDVIGR